MDMGFSATDEEFRAEARTWLTDSLNGEFQVVKGRGGPGDEHSLFDERLAWEQHMGAHGWTCIGWPAEHGGRDLSLHQQVIWYEEYARAKGPGRLGHIGEGLVGPTVLHFGTDEQKQRFLPGIRSGTELWCQGYSEPDAGSDLANIKTRAERDGDEWVIHGQKVWTSLAQWSQWCFVLARTDRDAEPKHRGISFFMVPMDQPGIEIRPIQQVTGTAEFNEVFFDGARCSEADLIGGENKGWGVAMGLLAFERGASTLGQQLAFRNELDAVIDTLRANGRLADPVVRQKVIGLHAELEIMRWNTLRVLSTTAETPPEALITKLYWATWHRALGELAVDAGGAWGMIGDPVVNPHDPATEPGDELTEAQRIFLFTRSDTIYGGSNQVQRNIIGERGLGLPREPR